MSDCTCVDEKARVSQNKLVGGSELARIVGVTPQAVSKAADSGRITVAEVSAKGKLYDLDKAVEQWNATREAAALQNRASYLTKEMQGGMPKEQDENSNGGNYSVVYLKAKAKRETIKAEQEALELRVRQCELIEISLVEKDGEEFGAILLGYLQAFPDRHSDVLAGMNIGHDIRLYLRKELNELIIEIRKRFGIKDNAA